MNDDHQSNKSYDLRTHASMMPIGTYYSDIVFDAIQKEEKDEAKK